MLRQEVINIQTPKNCQILCAHKHCFLMPGHHLQRRRDPSILSMFLYSVDRPVFILRWNIDGSISIAFAKIKVTALLECHNGTPKVCHDGYSVRYRVYNIPLYCNFRVYLTKLSYHAGFIMSRCKQWQ